MEHDARLTTTAAEVMQRRVFSLFPDWTLARAVRELLRRGFSGAPVVDRQGKLLGVLSDRDCIQVLASAAFHAMPGGEVADAMHTDMVTVSPATDLLRLTYLFHENPFRRIPVIDEDGHLVGIISRRDVLKALDATLRLREAGRRESTYESIQKHWEHEK